MLYTLPIQFQGSLPYSIFRAFQQVWLEQICVDSKYFFTYVVQPYKNQSLRLKLLKGYY